MIHPQISIKRDKIKIGRQTDNDAGEIPKKLKLSCIAGENVPFRYSHSEKQSGSFFAS